jgi:hypothetical protein
MARNREKKARPQRLVLTEKRQQSQSVLRETPLAKWWHRKHRTEVRRCCICGVAVKNSNLGGLTDRSALSGRQYCLHCEDVGGCL